VLVFSAIILARWAELALPSAVRPGLAVFVLSVSALALPASLLLALAAHLFGLGSL
jgi:hypothetical protein